MRNTCKVHSPETKAHEKIDLTTYDHINRTICSLLPQPTTKDTLIAIPLNWSIICGYQEKNYKAYPKQSILTV